MTTERTTPPAGFDTLAEARRLEAAGVPAEHGAAMLYAVIAATDARNADLPRRRSDATPNSARRWSATTPTSAGTTPRSART